MPKFSRIKIGDRYGRLTVIEQLPSKNYRRRFLCKCDCGVVKSYIASDLLNGNTKSCGCLAKELLVKRNSKYPHNMKHTRLYNIWWGMKQRCYDKNHSAYKKYGAKGIEICNEWKNDFMRFYEWSMSNGYTDTLTIDRIDSTGNYEPSNCRWVTIAVQANNKSIVKRYDFDGQIHTIKEWSEIVGINYKCLYYRIKHLKWPIDKALTTPIRKR